MKKNNKNQFVQTLCLCFAFFPYVGLSNIIGNESLLNILKIVSLLFFSVNLFKEFRFKTLNINIYPLILFTLYSIFVLLYNSNVSGGIIFGIIFTLVSSLYLMISFENKRYEVIKALYILFNISILLNFYSVITSLSLTEYHKLFLLGGKNSLTIFCISSIYFSYLYFFLFSKKYTFFGIISIILSILTLLLSGSSTGLIIGILIILAIFFVKKINIKFKYYFIIYIVLLFLVLNSQFFLKIPFIYEFITLKLNKDLSFTGRTNIWNKVLFYIRNNFLGYGRGNSIVSTFTLTNECHNAILELMLCDGYPGLLFFIMYMYKIFKKNISSYKQNLMNISKFIIFCIFLLGLTESIIYKIELWWILIITFSINYYELEREKNNDNNTNSNL